MKMVPLNFLTGLSLIKTIDKKTRDELIMKYVPLVKNIVGRIILRLPDHISKDDLINVGVMGLMSALEKFDATRNVRFETYAGFRIRGAVLDELRARDVVPRSVRSKETRLEEAFEALQKELTRHPTDDEVSDYLGISLENYYKLLDEAKGICILSNDDLPQGYCEKCGQYEVLEKIDQGNPFSLLAHRELKETLKNAIDSLPKKERLVLSLYYYEELTLKEIGVVIKLTESRICQIRSQAILRLRTSLRELKYVVA
ncbi:MAG: FliA/WhiG family RNA polymerase sigma factor [Desulfobacterales bacterium]|nr:FliA/WhiG family RNA polymerase sigma factor [Desulfobacterales bacterium]